MSFGGTKSIQINLIFGEPPIKLVFGGRPVTVYGSGSASKIRTLHIDVGFCITVSQTSATSVNGVQAIVEKLIFAKFTQLLARNSRTASYARTVRHSHSFAKKKYALHK